MSSAVPWPLTLDPHLFKDYLTILEQVLSPRHVFPNPLELGVEQVCTVLGTADAVRIDLQHGQY